MMDQFDYSVLMSVYHKEDPEWFRLAIQSMIDQTVPPSEFVLVEDGPLTKELYDVVDSFFYSDPALFKVVTYPENHGLGYALRKGVEACSMPIIARMDSDDWARPDRMEIQLALMAKNQLDMIGSQVTEFIDSPDEPLSLTNLPEDQGGIVGYSRRRNPFRHPPMVFKRNRVLEAGNYSSDYMYFEDWDLFNRLLADGCRAQNVHDPLVAMRVSPDFYARRGGFRYLSHAWKFKYGQLRSGWFTMWDFVASFLPQAVVCLMPNLLRTAVYKKALRKRADA